MRRTARGWHRGRRPARPEQPALLRRQGPDPHVRPPVDRLAVHEPARLDELRQRPRGRQRPVRAELHFRRRAHHCRPRDLLPLHGPHAGPRGGHGGDLHAQAVHAPDRQWHCTSTSRSGRPTAATCSPAGTAGTGTGSGSRGSGYQFAAGVLEHARGHGGRHLPHGQQLQANGGRPAELGRDVGTRRTSPTAATTGPS